MCSEAKNIFHQGASWLCCLATHDQRGWQHHELSGWAGCNYQPGFHFIKFHLQILRISKCAYLEDFTIVNGNKTYFLKKLYSTIWLWVTTKTWRGWNNNIFHGKILFLKEKTTFNEWGSRGYFCIMKVAFHFCFMYKYNYEWKT